MIFFGCDFARALLFQIAVSFKLKSQPFPDLPFLAFLDFLAFFVARNFLAFLSVFPFFPRDCRGSAQRKNPCFFGWCSLLFPKKQGKEDQGCDFAIWASKVVLLALAAAACLCVCNVAFVPAPQCSMRFCKPP